MSEEAEWLTPEEAAAWVPYVAASFALFSQLDDDLRSEFDISHFDYGVLVQLTLHFDEGIRMAVLADRFGVRRSYATYRVGRLEARGLVERSSVVDDGRGVVAHITPAGEEMLRAAAPAHVASVRRLFIDRLAPSDLAAIASAFAPLARDVDPALARGSG